jgi:Ti type entry exclusion protein TrbK
VSRATIIVLVVGTVSMSAAALWLVLPRGSAPVAADPAPASMPNDAERRQRAQEFFGGDPDRDVRGGQEMKPRW